MPNTFVLSEYVSSHQVATSATPNVEFWGRSDPSNLLEPEVFISMCYLSYVSTQNVNAPNDDPYSANADFNNCLGGGPLDNSTYWVTKFRYVLQYDTSVGRDGSGDIISNGTEIIKFLNSAVPDSSLK
jgi:hypothetical protein